MVECAATVEAGAGDGRGGANRGVVAGAFILFVARLEVVAVIRGEEDDGVVEFTHAAERIDQATEGFVEAFDHTAIAGPVLRRATDERL